MITAEQKDRDDAILAQIRELSAELSDERVQVIVGSVIDAVMLNPQPIPPGIQEILRSVVDAVALNPQPLPPSPEPDGG